MCLKQVEDRGIVTLTLNRPEARNALNPALVAALYQAITALAAREDVRALVFRGEGAHFCAGADLGGMRDAGAASEDTNRADASRLADFFHVVASFPAPVVAAVQGAALGGALGLVACADLVVAHAAATFGTPEVRVGLAPATISPYVLRRLGPSRSADLLLTGRRIAAATALDMGLVHRVVNDLDAGLNEVLGDLSQGGPQALRATKALLLAAAPLPDAAERARTVEALVRIRATEEAKAGLLAFLEKRAPVWGQP